MEFQDKVVFLTGSGGGIGLAIAQALIRQNASVAMIDVKAQPDDLPEGPAAPPPRPAHRTHVCHHHSGAIPGYCTSRTRDCS